MLFWNSERSGSALLPLFPIEGHLETWVTGVGHIDWMFADWLLLLLVDARGSGSTGSRVKVMRPSL